MFNKQTDKKVFAKGGITTYLRYGKSYMRMIGKKGGRPRKPTVDNLHIEKKNRV